MGQIMNKLGAELWNSSLYIWRGLLQWNRRIQQSDTSVFKLATDTAM
ncbi:rCG44290 [Rattus norvegicus]|uniref:RCG44290 n=1 Tax=Rattus norvegicus TaxID=10116 RepID=A6KD91_RAT|nr:rCG44290 [Rattus norvegicus]